MRVERYAPLTRAQEFEWLKTTLPAYRPDDEGSSVCFGLRAPDGVTAAGVTAVVSALVERHESLRTVVVTDGREPRQAVLPARPFGLVHGRADGEAAREAFRRSIMAEAATFADARPLHAGIRWSGEAVAELVVAVSHVCCDGASRDVLEAEAQLLLADAAAGRPLGGTLPPAPQAADLALTERGPAAGKARERALRHWAAVVREAPNRCLPPRREREYTRYGYQYTSGLTPPLLQLAARYHGASPAVLYEAALHAGLAVLSGHHRTMVRAHYSAREPATQGVVGCLHRVLPAVVRTEAGPKFSDFVRNTAAARLTTQRRHHVGHLELCDLVLRAERERGVALAEGVTLNFLQDADFRRLGELAGEELAAQRRDGAEQELLMGNDGTRPDHLGSDAYFYVMNSGAATVSTGGFNGAVFSPGQIRFLITLPDLLLGRAADDDPVWEEIVALAAPSDLAAPSARHRGPDTFDPDVLLSAVRDHPGVTSAELRWEDGEPVLAATARDVGLKAAGIREYLMAQLSPAAALICPERITVRNQPGAVGLPEPEKDTADSDRLAALLCREGYIDRTDPELSFTECGGTLAELPGVLRTLRAGGWAGLSAQDLLRPVSLRTLARISGGDDRG